MTRPASALTLLPARHAGHCSRYGITPGLIYSFPVTCAGDGSYTIVQGLDITPEKAAMMKTTEEELVQEKKDADEILAGSA